MLETILRDTESIVRTAWAPICQYNSGWESGVPYLTIEDPLDEPIILDYDI